jgi:hypothetical protein
VGLRASPRHGSVSSGNASILQRLGMAPRRASAAVIAGRTVRWRPAQRPRTVGRDGLSLETRFGTGRCHLNILLLSLGGGNILRSVKDLFRRDLAVTQKTDGRFAERLRRAVTTRFLDTNEFQEPREEQVAEAVRTCWQTSYYAFSKQVGTSLVCIQGTGRTSLTRESKEASRPWPLPTFQTVRTRRSMREPFRCQPHRATVADGFGERRTNPTRCSNAVVRHLPGVCGRGEPFGARRPGLGPRRRARLDTDRWS